MNSSEDNKYDWKKSPKFLAIRGITSKEVFTPCGVMERGTPIGKGDWLPKNFKKPATDEKVFAFGKYRGQSIKDIVVKDPYYVNWCRENVKGFKE